MGKATCDVKLIVGRWVEKEELEQKEVDELTGRDRLQWPVAFISALGVQQPEASVGWIPGPGRAQTLSGSALQ